MYAWAVVVDASEDIVYVDRNVCEYVSLYIYILNIPYFLEDERIIQIEWP